uniref:Uncharacterized protein n=1 Tax=Arundo donax TaxID=35708 RepID=A0A0A9GRE6_ARUDO
MPMRNVVLPSSDTGYSVKFLIRTQSCTTWSYQTLDLMGLQLMPLKSLMR